MITIPINDRHRIIFNRFKIWELQKRVSGDKWSFRSNAQELSVLVSVLFREKIAGAEEVASTLEEISALFKKCCGELLAGIAAHNQK
jgi:hypothetical protein